MLLGGLAACVTQTAVEVGKPAPAGVGVALHLQPCVDRTQTPDRDLGAEATAALAGRLGRTPDFRLEPQAPYAVSCEVTHFIAGSALKRWVLPGWGETVGQVAVMVTDEANGEVVLIVRGNARVGSGGLYTLGADTYILAAAVDDVVQQMRAWAQGHSGPASFTPASGRRGHGEETHDAARPGVAVRGAAGWSAAAGGLRAA